MAVAAAVDSRRQAEGEWSGWVGGWVAAGERSSRGRKPGPAGPGPAGLSLSSDAGGADCRAACAAAPRPAAHATTSLTTTRSACCGRRAPSIASAASAPRITDALLRVPARCNASTRTRDSRRPHQRRCSGTYVACPRRRRETSIRRLFRPKATHITFRTLLRRLMQNLILPKYSPEPGWHSPPCVDIRPPRPLSQ